MTDEESAERDAKIHYLYALVIGYNEMAAQAETLGAKLYFRLARNQAVEMLEASGGKLEIKEDQTLVVMPFSVHVNLYEKDIELIRVTLAVWDASHPKHSESP